ncbi:hypothetical protein SDC9_150606 [bioreactor metagenome]|uniref:Uncharacterized protein n=1 Tax=bioreactor metagenome TaxID=1076179 RepID=A0A645ENI6_9ZZZZ
MVGTYESHLITAVQHQIKIIQDLFSLNRLGQALHFKNVLAALAFGFERYVGETAAGRLDVVDGELVDELLAAGGLFGLRHVTGEAHDELFQFGYLLFPSLLVILHLLCGKLT